MRSTAVQGWLERGGMEALAGLPLRLRLWDGGELGDANARWTIELLGPEVLAAALADPDRGLAGAFCAGRMRVQGDLPSLLTAAFRAGLGREVPVGGPPPQDREAAQRNAQHHYDLGNGFYRAWLDEEMVYTCAYYPRPDAGLEEAQRSKLDHVCRKLALRPGERVVEAGCGWGGLALWMAEHYGVEVQAWNVSEEQVRFGQERARERGLSDRVQFVLDDWRAVPGDGRADAFVSVGMLEHVGPAHYGELGAVISGALRPEGRGLLHSIGRAQPRKIHPWIEEQIFPHAHPPTLGEMMGILEPAGLVTLDVENLRRHYARTTLHWYERYLRAWDQVVAEVGEERARTWQLYLAGSHATFAIGGLELFQLVFARVGSEGIPWTRALGYAGEDGFGGGAVVGGAAVGGAVVGAEA